MEGLLKDRKLLSNDRIIAPELAVYEVANSVWKHEHILKDLGNGKPYLSILYGLIEAGRISVLSPNESLMQESYLMAKRNGITIYDAIFITLSIKLGVTLKTFDKTQTHAFKLERNRSI